MTILFVCTGNSCRSPMAEAVFRQLVEDAGCPDITVRSAGVSAPDGMPATPQACFAASLEGADLTSHRSQPLDDALVARANHIVTMTHSHLQTVRALYPDAAGKTSLLLSHIGRDEDIPDPIGGTSEDYVRCLQQMKPALNALCGNVCGAKDTPALT